MTDNRLSLNASLTHVGALEILASVATLDTMGRITSHCDDAEDRLERRTVENDRLMRRHVAMMDERDKAWQDAKLIAEHRNDYERITRQQRTDIETLKQQRDGLLGTANTLEGIRVTAKYGTLDPKDRLVRIGEMAESALAAITNAEAKP